MPAYVDSSRFRFRGMKMCHLIADTLAELHEMARRIGIARKHFQEHASFPHYDICKSKREIAVNLGARELTSRELVAVMRRFRTNHPEEKQA